MEKSIIADKSVSIKGATDEQLNALLKRLRKENEVQMLVSDLKRRSESDNDGYDYRSVTVPTEAPIESLYHYGVLGMKWGKRTRRIHPSKDPARTSADHKKKVELKQKKVYEMSNDDLRALTTRMQLEKQYRDLKSTDISAGQKFVKDIFVGAAKTSAQTYVNSKIPKLKP